MGYRLREFKTESKFSRELDMQAIGRVVPKSEVEAAIAAVGVEGYRERKLNMVIVIFLLVAINIYTYISMGAVMRKIAKGLRFIWPDPDYPVPKDSAITYRRYQLGARPLVALFHQVCRPMAVPETPGAFLFGLRLMAIDGTTEDVPDTPANAAAFGRHTGGRGESAYPQVRGVYLVECGTHALVDAGFWPYRVSEYTGARRVLRSVTPAMLLMWDAGLHDYDMIAEVLRRASHVLSRLPANVQPKLVRRLPDGSCLAYIYPSDYQRRKQGERLLVRIIEYTINDPTLPGHGKRYRLITTLLDHEACPASELACAYHERWEIELVIDEVDTHQRLAARTLRSLKPVGVIQELYALLIAHYVIRFLMHEAALQQGIDPDRLSFVHGLEVLRDAIPEFQMTTPEQLPQLYARMLRDIAEGRLPERRLRSSPRVVKRKMSKFRVKRPEHYNLPQPTRPFCESVVILI